MPQTSQRCSFLLIREMRTEKRDDEIKHCGHIVHHPTLCATNLLGVAKKRQREKKREVEMMMILSV